MKTDLGADYLHAEDLLNGGKWGEYSLTIAEVLAPGTIKSADGKVIERAILAFQETQKRLILGKVNERLAKCAIGSSKPKEWIGKKITIHASRGNWFGQKDVAAIRIRVPDGKPKPFLMPAHLGVDITGVTV